MTTTYRGFGRGHTRNQHPRTERQQPRRPARNQARGQTRPQTLNGIGIGRSLFMAGVIVAIGLIVTYRLVSLQVLNPAQYVEYGESARIRSQELPAQRGSIVDRNGIEFAVSSPRLSVYADPRVIVDPAGAALAISEITGQDHNDLSDSLARSEKSFRWVMRQTDNATAQAVLDLSIPGIYTIEEQARLSPSGSTVARSIVGSTDIDGKGVSGIEVQFEAELTGESGQIVVERGLTRDDGQRLSIPDGRYELIAPKRGNDVVLTLDRTLQFEVESLLSEVVTSSGAENATAIVSRPKTGEILAMASVDAGEGYAYVSSRNRSVSDVFEPGSIAKPVAVAGMLERNLITADTRIEVTDQLEIYDAVITDTVGHATSDLSTGEILSSSSNVGMALLSERLGKDGMYETLANFGVGDPTNLGFPGERGGNLHPVEEWSGVALSSASFGYGFSATPLQMLRSYNVFANGGILVEPYVAAGIDSESSGMQLLESEPGKRVVSEETAKIVTELLVGVVESGTGQLASVPGYQIAGKTGTARIAQPGGGYNDAEGNVHLVTTFAGYLPASNPELSIIVVIRDPDGEASGGGLAAPVFGDISNFALQHFRIAPASQGN